MRNEPIDALEGWEVNPHLAEACADKIDINGHCDPDLRSTDKLLMTYTHKDGEVAEVWELRRQGCGERYSLWWKCDPWNSFEERYFTLPLAVARLASIIKCFEASNDDERLFTHDQTEFVRRARELL